MMPHSPVLRRSSAAPILSLVAAVLAISLVLAPAAAPAQTEGIQVTGEGSVAAVPDMATITLGVSARDRDPAAAVNATSEAVTSILDRLDGLGIAPRDVQTAELSLRPTRPARDGSAPEIAGFEASNRVTLRVRALARLGTILQAVLQDGANRLDGLRYGLQDPAPLIEQARRRAVADAQARAALYAEAAGVPLGPVRSISETGRMPRPQQMMAVRDDAVPVAAGEITLTARVSMHFGIGPAAVPE
jgi:uncharacterized protein YggE